MLLLSFFAITDAFCLTFYVDTSTGKDNPAQGVKLEKPWKTITYALQQTCMIDICEEVIIEVAAGEYYETVTIAKRPVSLVGTGLTTIDGGGGSSLAVITISGVKNVLLSNFTIQKGKTGIYAENGASLQIDNVLVRKNDSDGILIYGHSQGSFSGDLSCLENGRFGFFILENSTAVFNGASVKANNNLENGVMLYGSSSLSSYNSSIEIADNKGSEGLGLSNLSSLSSSDTNASITNNGDLGISITGNSRFHSRRNDNWEIWDHKESGLITVDSSDFKLGSNCNLKLRNSENINLNISDSSSAALEGNVEISESKYGIIVGSSSGLKVKGPLNVSEFEQAGIMVLRTSSIKMFEPALMTISNAKTTAFTGLNITEGSVASAHGGTLTIEDNPDNGVSVLRNANFTIRDSAVAMIKNNGGFGVSIGQNSSCQLRDTVSEISNNASGGIAVSGSSHFMARYTRIINNDRYGIGANEGSSILIRDAIINGNNSGDDVNLYFGAHSSIYNSTIGTIACDGTVLSRGDHMCPTP